MIEQQRTLHKEQSRHYFMSLFSFLTGPPVEVLVSMFIVDISSVSEVLMVRQAVFIFTFASALS